MINELYFALYAIKKNVQSNAELRTSFIANIIGMMINNTSFLIIWIFFIRSVGIINGWTAADILGLQGFSALCFGIVFSAGGGIRHTAEYVSSGSFDRFLLSPKNLLLRLATSSFGVSAVGDMLFGVACLAIYATLLHTTPYQVAFICVLVILSTMVFLAAVVTVYSASFLFVDSNTVVDGLFELFLTPALFHGGAFRGGMRFIFTFVIPSLLIGTLPVEAVRNASLEKLLLITLLSFAWLLISFKLFYAGVRKYESSNFMTFGS
ncbi:ABC-2 family transporter protein [Candidatus Kaiserbacteria bacterium]|nr:ABC-2 family transporter protein [Candidatus Kaiserbacteria bacterium]